jgi:N-methylhydantoinase A/oxoprolinase/acetone carboxylase beta subunit
MPFGGAGALHAGAVARALGMREILVPPAPGILCAQGLIVADLREDFVRTLRVPLDGGGDHACVPARMAGRSGVDLLVPPAFAGLAVGASACFVRALAIGRRHDEY